MPLENWFWELAIEPVPMSPKANDLFMYRPKKNLFLRKQAFSEHSSTSYALSLNLINSGSTNAIPNL